MEELGGAGVRSLGKQDVVYVDGDEHLKLGAQRRDGDTASFGCAQYLCVSCTASQKAATWAESVSVRVGAKSR